MANKDKNMEPPPDLTEQLAAIEAGKTEPPPPVTPIPLDPLMVQLEMAKAMQMLAAQMEANRNAAATPPAAGGGGGVGDDRLVNLMETLSTALVRLSESNIEGSKLIADETRRAHRPSNEIAHNRSVFNRRGVTLPEEEYKKPALKCIMMIPWLIEWESINREEVELLNLLQEGEYILSRVDRTKIRVTVHVDYKVDNVTPSRLIMNHETAFNNDNKDLMPPLTDWLRMILRQHDPETRSLAAAVMSDEEEEALIEAGQLSVSK